jgi:hypothetical protein
MSTPARLRKINLRYNHLRGAEFLQTKAAPDAWGALESNNFSLNYSA